MRGDRKEGGGGRGVKWPHHPLASKEGENQPEKKERKREAERKYIYLFIYKSPPLGKLLPPHTPTGYQRFHFYLLL